MRLALIFACQLWRKLSSNTESEWLERVMALGHNRVMLPALFAQIRGPGVIPFVGAGLSAPYNLP